MCLHKQRKSSPEREAETEEKVVNPVSIGEAVGAVCQWQQELLVE